MLRKRIAVDIPPCEECSHHCESLFCSLDNEHLSEFSREKSHLMYKKGQVIFFEGNQPHGVYCINEGKVKVYKIGEDGKEQIVRFAKESGMLGYRALLSGEAYTATAIALVDTFICHIPKTSFLHVLEENQGLSLKVIQMLTNDLKTSEQRLLNMAQKPVRERIAESLLMLKESFGMEPDGDILAISLTRREIGDLAGATTETAIRVLSDLNKEEVIELMGKKIKIKSHSKLVRIANIYD